MKIEFVRGVLLLASALGVVPCGQAWDYEGHRVVNQLALSSLPTNFPAFVKTGANSERIAFLAGEPDRWRNSPDLPFKHASGPEHYMDMEQLADYELKAESLPIFRYDFVAQLGVYRRQHPEKFAAPAEGKNEDHTRELIGFLPYAISENYSKLKSGFSYLKAFEAHGGTPEEIANAQANIVYVMGVMGHFAGDASQPLHATKHHHGWVGANPEHYATNSRIHAWIDGGFFNKIGGADLKKLQGKARPARLLTIQDRPAHTDEVFQASIEFLLEQQKLVEKVYQLDRDHKIDGEPGAAPEGRDFLEGQLLKGGQLLGDLWYSAWQQAPEDSFLKGQLNRRSHH